MTNKFKFDLPELFETTIVGFIEVFRCYFLTLFLFLFRPAKFKERVVNHLQTEGEQTGGLSRPFTFVLMSWFLVNIYGPFLARYGREIEIQHLLPTLRDSLKVEVLVIHFIAPLCGLIVVYTFFKFLFQIAKIEISFYDALTAIAYPFGVFLLVVIPYPDIRLIIPKLFPPAYAQNPAAKLLAELIALYAFWMLISRVYQVVGSIHLERRKILKRTILIVVGVIWAVGSVFFYCL